MLRKKPLSISLINLISNTLFILSLYPFKYYFHVLFYLLFIKPKSTTNNHKKSFKLFVDVAVQVANPKITHQPNPYILENSSNDHHFTKRPPLHQAANPTSKTQQQPPLQNQPKSNTNSKHPKPINPLRN